MRRDTLATFIRGAVLAALPLVGGCGGAPYIFPCGQATYVADGGLGDAGMSDAGCAARCTMTFQPMCREQTNSAGLAVTECTGIHRCGGGRRPDGLVESDGGDGGSAIGQYFAAAAHLEAASVPAFRRLRAELRAHGAPRRLADACRRAARDEIRHARSAERLARRFGATRPPVRIAATAPRTLMALAVENAREGCVAESFAALLAAFGAATAADAEVRAHLQAIAADEARHAEVAWAIDAWLRTRLSPRERAHLAAVRAEELARLAMTLEAPVDDELARAAGLPSPIAARALHRAFAAEVARRA